MVVKGFKDTISWYDQNAEQYAQASLSGASPEEIKEFVSNLPKGAKVLDAGCGSGRDTHLLNREGMDTTGLDLSSGLIKVARRLFPDAKFVEGNMLNLEFEDNSFDGIWAHASLLHLETPEDVAAALKEFNRVLKTDGVMHVLVKAQIGDVKTAVVSDSLSNHDRFFQYFTTDEMTELLHNTGFQVSKIEKYKETDRNPKGRPEVEWILALAKK
jgi:ubiquinone/menaquinone biosynthesis C-methylase UbiE